MKLLITGAGGFLGAGLIATLESRHQLRLLDVVKFDTPHELITGDVTDFATCQRAVAGPDALVIAHMAPNRPEVYATPTQPFDVNVKGTANLFAAAVAAGIRRVVLISSVAVVGRQYAVQEFLGCGLPAQPVNLYGLTKTCQESIAEFYHRTQGVAVALLRPGYITDADTLRDKYGHTTPTVNWQFIFYRRRVGRSNWWRSKPSPPGPATPCRRPCAEWVFVCATSFSSSPHHFLIPTGRSRHAQLFFELPVINRLIESNPRCSTSRKPIAGQNPPRDAIQFGQNYDFPENPVADRHAGFARRHRRHA